MPPGQPAGVYSGTVSRAKQLDSTVLEVMGRLDIQRTLLAGF